MKYLREFKTEALFNDFMANGIFLSPAALASFAGSDIVGIKKDAQPNYFYVEDLSGEENTITLQIAKYGTPSKQLQKLETSTDCVNWLFLLELVKHLLPPN